MSSNIPLPKLTNLGNTLSNLNFVKKRIMKWVYGQQGYNQYGLYHDDLYRDGHEDVAEAVRRLPEDLYTSRVHRLHRAIQLSRNKIYLPESMWTPQEDKHHHYLTPYLNEVMKEKMERAAWDRK